MSNTISAFRAYEDAVDALRQYFLGQDVPGRESPEDYNFSHQIELAKGWQTPLLALVTKLLAASFEVKLEVKLGGYEQEFEVLRGAEQPRVQFTASDGQHAEYEKFKSMVDDSQTFDVDQLLDGVLDVIAEWHTDNSLLQISLTANLTKSTENISATTQISTRQKVTYYLFAKNLASDLERMTLTKFEQNFCKPHQRSVIVIFDTAGLIAGDLLVICGRGHENALKGWLTEPLSEETIKKTENALSFRKSQSFGDFQPAWLTPDFFGHLDPAQATPLADELRTLMKSFRGMLSVLFLADYSQQINDMYRVEYRGIGVVNVDIDRQALVAQEKYADDLFELYSYAYEGVSPDKLEIVQQFISLITSDLTTLCRKATELREAVEKTYATVLRNKVSVYFDAVNKIQERVKTVVDKSAEGVISLSREVSGDVYKVVGIIAAAISVALLKPDFGLAVALAAALVLAVYMMLVIFYHLQTLERAHNLSMDQHAGYIESFRDVLGSTKVEEFLANEHLMKAQSLFRRKRSDAAMIYTLCLVLSLSVATVIVGYKLLTVK